MVEITIRIPDSVLKTVLLVVAGVTVSLAIRKCLSRTLEGPSLDWQTVSTANQTRPRASNDLAQASHRQMSTSTLSSFLKGVDD